MLRRMVVQVVLAGFLCALLAGCGSKVSQSNYDKLTNGMSLADVEGILGKGTEDASVAGTVGSVTGSAKTMTWKDGEKSITVTFVNDKLTMKKQKGL